MVFGGAGAVQALQNVDLHVRAGEFVSLIGPSGCGKSTLLRLIGDLLAPTSGTISVNGKSPREARLSRQYGIVFQQPVLYDWRTVTQNVQLPLEVMKVAPAERRARASELLDLVGLTEFANHYPWQLSGGMQQRVSIARALSFRPSVLLMDEPFGALDALTRAELQREFLHLHRQLRKTTVFVTHDLREALLLGSRIALLEAGRLLAAYTPGEFLNANEPLAAAYVAAFRTGNNVEGGP
jgi:NitT/TauT family transport system ATP-binding protein